MGRCYENYVYYTNKSNDEAANERRYSCEIDRLKILKQQQINEINRINSELRKEENALSELNKAISNTESDLRKAINNISDETSSVSSNFTNMVVCSSTSAMNLSSIFGTEFSNEATKLKQMLEDLVSKKEVLNKAINQKNSDLKTLNSNLSNTESEITKNTTFMNEANRLKRSYASTADDYYRRYRNGEDDPVLAT